MKKAYVKPDIIFEDFTLSTSIAAGCERQTDTPSWNMCGVAFGNMNLFLSSISACTDPVEDDGSLGYCYHNPSDLTNLFNSL